MHKKHSGISILTITIYYSDLTTNRLHELVIVPCLFFTTNIFAISLQIFLQEEGTYLATAFDVFHMGINLGPCVNEALNCTSIKWAEEANNEYCSCSLEVVKIVFSGLIVNGVPQAVCLEG